ncbi:hypothetical protein AgCh_013428 [Apium graveolens]
MSSLSLQVFVKGVDKDDVVLMAARASRLENQDAIDVAIVTMLADPKQARAGITEIHFLPFNPTDKRTALTYIDKAGTMHRVSKCAPEQEVPEGNKDSSGGPWEFIALLPLFDPPRHDSAETIRRALELGVSDILHYGKSMENAMRACCKGIKIRKILIHRDGDNGKQLPYENITLVQAAVGVVQKVNAWGLRPTILKHTLPKLVDLLENYWQQDPVLRPDFTEIIRILQQIVKEVVLFFLVSQ